MRRILSSFLTIVMVVGIISSMPVTVFATVYDDVESISFSPVEPITMVLDIDSVEGICDAYPDCTCDCFFPKYDYKEKLLVNEAILTVNFSDGESRDYYYDIDGPIFSSEVGDQIDEEEIIISDNQAYSHWYEPGEYSCTITYAGCTTTVPVTIIEKPTASFIPAEPIILFEGQDTIDWGTYCEYSLSVFDLCQEGNIFSLEYSDGTHVEYMYKSEFDDFFDESGNSLDIWNYWSLYSDQSEENQWSAGVHYFTLYDYNYGFSVKIPVTIKENPIESISYTPVETIELIENVDGYWSGGEMVEIGGEPEWFEYSFPTKNGDILTINYSDGTSLDFVFEEYAGFIDSDGNTISSYDIRRYSSQSYENRWGAGNSYKFVISYMGRETSVPVTIVENPIESISYIIEAPLEFVEEVEGQWREDVIWDDEFGEYIDSKYFDYDFYYWMIYDQLASVTINYKDGASKTYYSSEEDNCFKAEDGETLGYYNESEYDYIFDCEADTRNWKVGSDNYYTFTCLGIETNIPITIIENPVVSVSYTPAKPIELIEYADGYWNGTWIWNEDDYTEEYVEWFSYDTGVSDIFKNGDIITVTYKDGTVTEYECRAGYSSGGSGEWYSIFIDKDGNELPRGNEHDITNFTNNQSYDNQWTVGNEYNLSFKYMGRETSVPVKIIESPLKSISFTPAKPIVVVEMIDGYGHDMLDYFRYWCRYEQVGNTITVNYTDGTSKDFIYKGTEWISADGEELDSYYLYMRTDQDNNHWTEPGEYNFDIYYMGVKTEVPVTLIENNVKAVSIELAQPIVYNWLPDVADNPDGTSYYVSEETIRKDGNKIILQYKDGSVVEYTWSSEAYSIYNEGWCDSNNNFLYHPIYVWDDQYENPWEIGDDNYIYVECMNQTTTVPVTLVVCEHNWTSEGCYRQEPTCTNDGFQGEVCINCGSCREEVIPATGHSYSNEWTIDKKASCTTDGYESRHCLNCEEKTDTKIIPATGHTEVKDVAIAATCTETGLTEGSHCSVCNTVIKAQNVVKAKGHKPGSWKTDKKATVNSAGKKHRECSECGKTVETAKIAQLMCSKPKLKKIENTSSGIKITWGKVSGADKYYVYRKVKGGSYSKIGTTTKTYYTDKKAKSGKKYYYVVKAVNEAGSSSSSSSLSKYYLADPTLKTPQSTKKGVVLKWNKITGADGYVVYRKTGSGSYKKIATVKGKSKVTYTDKSAKKGKTYTYKVKAYKSETYSAYSNTKKIKDKY